MINKLQCNLSTEKNRIENLLKMKTKVNHQFSALPKQTRSPMSSQWQALSTFTICASGNSIKNDRPEYKSGFLEGADYK